VSEDVTNAQQIREVPGDATRLVNDQPVPISILAFHLRNGIVDAVSPKDRRAGSRFIRKETILNEFPSFSFRCLSTLSDLRFNREVVLIDARKAPVRYHSIFPCNFH